MPAGTSQDFLNAAQAKLTTVWEAITRGEAKVAGDIPPQITQAIARCVNSKTKTYRYVLPTQLCAKAADNRLDCRSVQMNCGLTGAFDARSVCDHVVVPFDRRNHSVLGGSTEPYANNPLRIPAILESQRGAQRDKAGFDDLRLVLEYAQGNSSRIEDLFRLVLQEIESRLATVQIVYPVPNRVSLKQADQTVQSFLSQRAGGARLQAVAVALFSTIGNRFGLFKSIRSHHINAADASTGSSADLECLDQNNQVVAAVEVKDRQLTLRHAQDKLPVAKAKGIREIIFLVQGGIQSSDDAKVGDLVEREFTTGQNLYVCEFKEFLNACLILLAEGGRRAFLQQVGQELDALKADLSHRQMWRELLALIGHQSR